MNDWLGVWLAVFLLAANAFFVAAEFALISSRRDRIDALVAQGKKRAQVVSGAMENLSLMMAASQLGITICSILLGKVGEPAIAHLLEPLVSQVGMPENLLHPVAFVIAMGIVVVLHILVGEMIPKNIAIAGPETSAMVLVPLHLVFCKVIKPVIHFCNWSANVVLRLFGVSPRDELASAVTPAELQAMLNESASSGLLDDEEHERLNRALRNEDRAISDVMIPIDHVRTVTASGDTIDPALIRRAVTETGFSRYPIVDEAGDLLGYLHIKDLLDVLVDTPSAQESIPVDSIRRMPSVRATVDLEQTLGLMRHTSAHMGKVLDSEGATIGVVALEDLLEEFVGTVRDGMHRRRGITRG